MSAAASPPHADDAPIFVIGWGRSGTSLLRSMLNAHPRIHLAQEANFYTWTLHRLPGTSARARLEAYLRSFSFAWLKIAPGLVRDRFAEGLTSDRLSEVYAFLMRTMAERHGRVRYGDKNPPNADYLARIFRDFKEPRVIRMMRDPRAVALSHTRMPFSSPSLALVNHMMKKTPERMRPYEDRMHTVQLERLVAEPRATLEGVLDFVGEAWDDAVLDDARSTPKDDGIPFPWLQAGVAPESRPPTWPASLSPAWIRLIEESNRETLERFGYEFARLDREPTSRERREALWRDAGDALPFLARAGWTLVRLALPPWVPAARNQHMLHHLNPRAWERRPDWVLPEPPPTAS